MRNRPACLIIVVLLCCFCLVSPAISESVAMKYVYIPDKQINIAVPENLITFEINDTVLDQRLIEYGITKDALLEAMQENGTYMYNIDPDLAYDINIVAEDYGEMTSLSFFNDSYLESALDEYQEMYESEGMKVVERSVYQTAKGIKLLRMKEVVTADPSQKMLQVIAVEDNQAIVVTLTTYTGIISKENERLMETIAEYSSFTKGPAETVGMTQAE